MLRNILTPAVPALAAKHVDQVLDGRTRARQGCRATDITGWILHAGGREILAAVGQRMGLTEDDTRWSAAILRDYGNVSSPCVYFVLRGGAQRTGARRILVDVVVRRGLQLPRRPAGGRVDSTGTEVACDSRWLLGARERAMTSETFNLKFSTSLPSTTRAPFSRGAICRKSTRSWDTRGW